MSSNVELIVNAKRFGGWKSVKITRSIESIAGSFDVTVTDKWGSAKDEQWSIAEEDVCGVAIDGERIITGYIDRRSPSIAGDTRTLSYSGRDRSAVLVDCDAELDKWSFQNQTILDIAKKVCAPFNIDVKLQDGLSVSALKRKQTINPGDKAFHVIEEAAKTAEVLVISDGNGGIIITRAGRETPAQPIVEGQNMLAGSAEYDGSQRYYRYLILTQSSAAGWPELGGTTGTRTRIRAEAFDEGVQRKNRVMLIRPEKNLTTDFAKRRVDWEARTRAAKAETVHVTVVGWRQPNSGKLWPVNSLCYIDSPSIGVKGQLLISQVEYSLDEQGEKTMLRLMRPDAFTPDPTSQVKTSGVNWKLEAPRETGVASGNFTDAKGRTVFVKPGG